MEWVIAGLVLLVFGFLLARSDLLSAKDLAAISDPKTRHDIKTANRDLLIKVFGGIGLVGTLVFTVVTARTGVEALDLTRQTVDLSRETFESTLKAQAADCYTKAVEQLGSDDETVRIGAIATLKGLLADAEQHSPAVDVLAAFVRANAKAPRVPQPLPPPNRPCDDRPPVQPALDIQAAMTALVQRDSSQERSSLDLRGVYLVGIELPVFANLAAAQLDYADLSYARLRGVDVNGASLKQARLPYACLIHAKMEITDTDHSIFDHAILNGVDSRATSHYCASMRGTGLIRANLEGTILRSTHLQGAFLQGIRLQGGGLDRADVTGARFNGAHLERANLRFAGGMTDAQIKSAYTDAATQLPLRKKPLPTRCVKR